MEEMIVPNSVLLFKVKVSKPVKNQPDTYSIRKKNDDYKVLSWYGDKCQINNAGDLANFLNLIKPLLQRHFIGKNHKWKEGYNNICMLNIDFSIYEKNGKSFIFVDDASGKLSKVDFTDSIFPYAFRFIEMAIMNELKRKDLGKTLTI